VTLTLCSQCADSVTYMVPLVLVALSGWKDIGCTSPGHHSAVDHCMIHVGRVLWTSCPFVVAGVRTLVVPRVLAFGEYKGMLPVVHCDHHERDASGPGFANHEVMAWFANQWVALLLASTLRCATAWTATLPDCG